MKVVREVNGKIVEINLPADCREATVEDLRRIEADKQTAEVRKTEALIKMNNRKRIAELKTELAKIKEDIEQEVFGLVRYDYAEKKARAAEIVNELRILEGKEPREIK